MREFLLKEDTIQAWLKQFAIRCDLANIIQDLEKIKRCKMSLGQRKAHVQELFSCNTWEVLKNLLNKEFGPRDQ